MARRLSPLAATALALGLATGCFDGDERPELGRLTGTVMTLDGRAPVQGARLFLIDPSTNTPSVPLVESGADGRYAIDGIPSGWHYLVVHAVYEGRLLLYDMIEAPFSVGPGARLEQDVFMHSYGFLESGSATVTGRVVDLKTGVPLPGAFVSIGSSDLLYLFSGTGFPWETLTDSKGEFRLSNPIRRDGAGGILGLYPVMASKAGYLPAATGSRLQGEWLPLADSADVVIRLPPGEGFVHVRGSVVHGDRAVSNVAVALALADTGFGVRSHQVSERGSLRTEHTLSPMAVMPGLVTQTDELGVFDIGGVPPGYYRIQAGYFPDDGWFSVNDQFYFEVRDNDVSGVRLQVLPAVSIVSPAHGATVGTGQPRFSWHAVEGADRYRVAFSPANGFLLTGGYIETSDTTAVMRSGVWGDGDHARWAVYAYRNGGVVAGPEILSWFEIDSR